MIKNWAFLVGLLLSLSLLWPLFISSYFTHHDDVQVIRLHQMDKCIKDFQIPCRWVPDLGGLYGYPLFNYYAPLPYYFGEIIYLITNNLIFSAKTMFAISFIGSYLFMYLLGRKFWGELGGSLSGLFYSFAPYHALDFYVRGAMGEMWALMFFPAIFLAIFRLRDNPKMQNVLLIAISITALLTSHNLSTMLFLPITLLLIVLIFFQSMKKKFLLRISLALILSFLLAAFYILPMTFEKNLVHVETTTSGYFFYTEHFKGFRKLFLDRSWGWGSSIREVPGGEEEKISFQIGIVHVLGWLLALFSALFLYKGNNNVKKFVVFSSLVITVSILMIHPRSEIIWRTIDVLKFLQFPWRFLMIVIFFISLVSGSIFLCIKNEAIKTKLWIFLSLALVIFNFSYFRPEKFLDLSDKDLLSGANWDRQIKRSIFDFLPIYAEAPPAELATSRYQILSGESEISDFKEGSNWISFKADSKSLTTIRLSQYYFPEWKVFIDGHEEPINYQNELGLITYAIDPGVHKIEARLYNTPIRNISNILSVLGLLIVLSLTLMQFSKTRKWVLYYINKVVS